MSLTSLLDNKTDHLYLLDIYDKKTLALWACRCAERVLKNFENVSADKRPRQGLETCYQRMEGKKTVHECRLAALATHAAAREVIGNDVACFAARAVGQAISTPHVAAHAIAAMGYARKSVYAAGGDVEGEYQWQMRELEMLHGE
ncbi:MAG: putative immunity protein [Candidatus Absconditabacterales bacterium]